MGSKSQIPEKEIYIFSLYFFNGYLAILGLPGAAQLINNLSSMQET